MGDAPAESVEPIMLPRCGTLLTSTGKVEEEVSHTHRGQEKRHNTKGKGGGGEQGRADVIRWL